MRRFSCNIQVRPCSSIETRLRSTSTKHKDLNVSYSQYMRCHSVPIEDFQVFFVASTVVCCSCCSPSHKQICFVRLRFACTGTVLLTKPLAVCVSRFVDESASNVFSHSRLCECVYVCALFICERHSHLHALVMFLVSNNSKSHAK